MVLNVSSDFSEGSRFHADLDYISECFDKTTKLRFRNQNEPEYIKFGSASNVDPKLGIRLGQLKLKGSVSPRLNTEVFR